ncbi:MAG: MATE family efflux transporter [Candidatus Bipolaricaulota bacterium]|nr:MATE family efflux transporter [Candidatus Bipolaricaulota bacterium]MDW8126339.1 MATE family efflux transporter [Candidatus Bipolaricaulota bacterium]
MRFRSPSTQEILSGPALPTMTRIGLPAVLGSLLFTLYNLADAFWIGRLPAGSGAEAMAGIQVSWPIIWFLISFISGFAGAAASALVAQYIGAGKPGEANFALNQLFTLSLGASVLFAGLGYVCSPPLLRLLVGRTGVAEAAALYIKIIFLGLPTMVLPGLFYSALAATGDTVTPLLVMGTGTVLNMALDAPLVLGWGPIPRMGIVGAAYATVASQGISTLVFLALFVRGKGVLKIVRSRLRPRAAWIAKGLRIGIPAALGQSSMAFGFVVMTAVIGRLPDAATALAGYGIGDRILGMLFILTDGLGVGLTTMVGQALGAGKFARARELVRKGITLLVGVLALEAAFLWPLRRMLVAVFMPSRPDVINMGASFIGAFAVSMPFLGTFFAAMSIYRGAGHNLPTMLLGFLRLWLLRIPLSWLFGFTLGLGASGVWWGMSLSNVVSGLIALALLLSGSWQKTVVEGPAEQRFAQ